MPRPAGNIITEFGENALGLWNDLGAFVSFTGEIASEMWNAVRHPRTVRFRETFYYLNICGPDAVPISLLICLLMGLIVGYQSAVQMHKYGADSFLPALVGCSIVRELGPLMIAIIATGRAGSAFTAEIATMKSTEELSAMVTMGFSPWRFLVVPKMIAMTTMMPLLTLMGDIVGIVGGLFVGVLDLGIPSQVYYAQTVWWVAPRFFVESITKSIVFAAVITSVSCLRGFQAEGDSLGVGRATTSSVVSSLVTVIVADFMMAKMFNIIFYGA